MATGKQSMKGLRKEGAIVSDPNSLPETFDTWYLEQSLLAILNLQNAFAKIEASYFTGDQKDELRSMLGYIFELAHAKMIEGREDNPVHHNTMALDLMIEIGVGERYEYVTMKNLAALSLLHDIGYAETTAKKWTSSEVESAVENKSEPEQQVIIAEAMRARDEHMLKGAGMVEPLLREANAHFQKSLFEEKDIHAIGEVVAIHDRPAGAKLKANYLLGSLSMDDLLPAKNDLAKVLRDADRLWMATAQGVKKDLISAGTRVTLDNLKSKLDSNCRSFRKEKKLYEKVYSVDKLVEFGFINDTLFRIGTGYRIFEQLSDHNNLIVQMEKQVQLAVDLMAGSIRLCEGEHTERPTWWGPQPRERSV